MKIHYIKECQVELVETDIALVCSTFGRFRLTTFQTDTLPYYKPGFRRFLIFVQQHLYFICMNTGYKDLTEEQRHTAVHRLTALWAFTESGLGGIMHALQIPFTGLVVGGMAVIIISIIASISKNNLNQLLKATMIVLIVKAMVSPYTPVTAYIAVSFQALLGYALFSFFPVSFFSILFLSSLAMMESAFQKLLVITLLFGSSFWKAMDEMLAFIIKQFGISYSNGSQWIVGSYLVIYLVGGVIIAWIAHTIIRDLFIQRNTLVLDSIEKINNEIYTGSIEKRKKGYTKLWALIFMLVVLSVVLFFFAADEKQGWLAVAKTVSWTLSAILVWFMLISPLLTKLIQRLLQKKQSRYSEEILRTLSFLPMLRQLTGLAWQKSRLYSGFNRWHFFFSAMVHWSLTCSDPIKQE